MIVRNAVLLVLGVGLNRGNVVFTGMAEATGSAYFPSMAELFLSIGLISVGILIYLFIVENFDVFPEHHDQPATATGGDNQASNPQGAGLARALITLPWNTLTLLEAVAPRNFLRKVMGSNRDEVHIHSKTPPARAVRAGGSPKRQRHPNKQERGGRHNRRRCRRIAPVQLRVLRLISCFFLHKL